MWGRNYQLAANINIGRMLAGGKEKPFSQSSRIRKLVYQTRF